MQDTVLKFCPVCATPLVWRADEEEAHKMRLACPDGHWTHWDNPVPVLAALVEYDGKILLARNALWAENKFALITGFMERGETPEAGIARELKEETSLDATDISLIGVYEFIRKNELIIAYHVRAVGEIKLSPELVDYKLVAPADLRPWPAGTGYAVANWMEKQGLPVQFVVSLGSDEPLVMP
jgi:NADH pyrophosphatase NudC (nudix superfamily)